jgi:inorganic pyrophosphatase
MSAPLGLISPIPAPAIKQRWCATLAMVRAMESRILEVVVNFEALPAFGKDETVNIVIESPRGSTLKLKYDPDLEAFSLSRPLVEGVMYPYDWGFVPSTLASDGDPLDAMVLWSHSSFPGVVLVCRLIGTLGVEQNSKRQPGRRERNDRVLALPVAAPGYAAIQDVSDLAQRTRDEIESFFLASTALEHKDIKFLGWSGAGAAYELVKAACKSALARVDG